MKTAITVKPKLKQNHTSALNQTHKLILSRILIPGAADWHLKKDTGLETVSWAWCKEVEQSTSKVFNKVFQLHLPLRLDVRAVHVCVEEDDGKGQDEDCVRVPELSHHTRIADAVALTADIK